MKIEKLRSTNKVVVERIRQHVLGSLSDDDISYTAGAGDKVYQQLQNVVNGFANWYGPYERRRTPNLQDAFIDWLDGLPSEIHTEHVFWNVRQVLDQWFETTEYTETADSRFARHADDRIYDIYKRLIHRELRNLMKIHSVDTKGLFV